MLALKTNSKRKFLWSSTSRTKSKSFCTVKVQPWPPIFKRPISLLKQMIKQQILISPRQNNNIVWLASTRTYTLFLASTVSAMHINTHISNASHPLVVTYYYWVTVYSPSMKAKNKKIMRPIPGIKLPTPVMGVWPLCSYYIRNPRVLLFLFSNADSLNYKSQQMLRTEKFS